MIADVVPLRRCLPESTCSDERFVDVIAVDMVRRRRLAVFRRGFLENLVVTGDEVLCLRGCDSRDSLPERVEEVTHPIGWIGFGDRFGEPIVGVIAIGEPFVFDAVTVRVVFVRNGAGVIG